MLWPSRDMDRTSAWKPPAINKTLAKQVAKVVDKHWAVTGVKSLQDIRDAIGKGVMTPMSMRDSVDNHEAVKKWKAGLKKDDLHKLVRWVEEIKNGRSNKQYRKTDEALRALKANRDIPGRVAARYAAKKQDPQDAVNEWLKKSKIATIIQGMSAEAKKDKLQFGMRDARAALKLWFDGKDGPKDPKHVAAWRFLQSPKGSKMLTTLSRGVGKALKDAGGGPGFRDIAKAVDTWMGY